MAAPVLEVRGVSMRFCRDTKRSLLYGLADIASEVWPWHKPDRRLRAGEFAAVSDLSFSLQPGEAIAVAGRNGAGKTTLLRLIAGLLKPDAGEIRIRGKVNPVIELGRGLNMELTGRENAALGLAWRGTPRREIAVLADAVADFSELGKMFDVPVSTYSAGMRSRLAFAISAHVPCDLMLLDEVLAVGDIAFQQKCMRFVQDFLTQGGSLLFVSHDAAQMQHVCRRGLLLDQGKLLLDGPVEDVVDRMFEMQTDRVDERNEYPVHRELPQILAVDPISERGDLPVLSGQGLAIRIRFFLPRPETVRLVCQIWTRDMSTCIAIFADHVRRELPAGEGEFYCVVPELPLVRGQYSVRASMVDPDLLVGIAEWGKARAPSLLEVDEAATRETLLRQNMGQLVHMQFRWEERLTALSDRTNGENLDSNVELYRVG